MTRVMIIILAAFGASCGSPRPVAQHPSPMEERTRRHDRIPERTFEGRTFVLEGLFSRPVTLVLPKASAAAHTEAVLLHLHGPAYPTAVAADSAGVSMLAVTVHLGAGSSVYERPFQEAGAFERLIEAVLEAAEEAGTEVADVPRVFVSAFSAGYGGVRALLRQPDARERIEGILLLDGLHTDYVPDATPLAEGGGLNGEKMAPFVSWARMAAAGQKRFLYTHSEVFPGTYASTTETADHLLSALDLAREPVLAWGPVGMQQLSRAGAGRFLVLGFAGNTAPDHVDHLHALPALLRTLLRMGEK